MGESTGTGTMSDHDELMQELEAIDAIYPDLLTIHTADSKIISIKVPQHENMIVQISFPANYPSANPPQVIEVRSNDTGSNDGGNGGNFCDFKYLQHLFQEVMDSCYTQNGSNSICLFDFLSELDGILYIEQEEHAGTDEPVQVPTDPFENWFASSPITDRGSTFMGFATRVNSEQEAFDRLEQMKTDSKIRKGNHAMCAWRIKQAADGSQKNDIIFQDSDDDGETAAGSRMLHLITIMDCWNVMVVVVRWFNGTHLGPDRFKHINCAAREAVVKAGF